MIDKKHFYTKIRELKLFDKLTKEQVISLDSLIDVWDKTRDEDLRKFAYVLGTVYHETAKTMLPIEEYGKGKGRKYGEKVDVTGKAYNTPDKLYYGRGFCQLTWRANYATFGRLLNVDLLNNPELALDVKVATDIIIIGMQKGLFTGVRLDRYFNSTKEEWLEARRIINGKDKAELIASHSRKFLMALQDI